MLYKITHLFSRVLKNIQWIRKSKNILAIHQSNFDRFVDFTYHKSMICRVCGKNIDLNNLGGWVKLDGELHPFCDDNNCLPIWRED